MPCRICSDLKTHVPVEATTRIAHCLCGAFAGLAGFISLSQTASASAAFAQNAEFLAIAAAVLGGTSLFGGRGTLWAPLSGTVLITTVQNRLAMINANPYAYPVITGAVIVLAALLDSLRSGLFRLGDSHRMIGEKLPALHVPAIVTVPILKLGRFARIGCARCRKPQNR